MQSSSAAPLSPGVTSEIFTGLIAGRCLLQNCIHAYEKLLAGLSGFILCESCISGACYLFGNFEPETAFSFSVFL